MKNKWKIAISGIVSLAVLALAYPFLVLMTPIKTAPPDTATWPDTVPEQSASFAPSHSIDKLLKEMEFGTIAFNAPRNVNINESYQIQLILSLAETTEQLKKSLSEEGEKIGATIKVSDRMEARLSGHKFQITAITPEEQVVSKIHSTEWKWEIHPKEKGEHKLHLTLTAILEVDGQDASRAIRTFSEDIYVNVTTSQKIGIFFKSNWQWLWAAILAPVVGWLWKQRKKSARG